MSIILLHNKLDMFDTDFVFWRGRAWLVRLTTPTANMCSSTSVPKGGTNLVQSCHDDTLYIVSFDERSRRPNSRLWDNK